MEPNQDNLAAAAGEPDMMARIVDLVESIYNSSPEVAASLAKDDYGWRNWNKDFDGYEFSYEFRKSLIEDNRVMVRTNPILVQAHRLWVNFGIGGGVTVNTEAGYTKTAKFLKSFWSSPQNDAALGALGQRNSAYRLLVDGDLFFVLVRQAAGQIPLVRRIQATEIKSIISSEDDADDILGYVRVFNPKSDPTKVVKYFYPNWTHEDLTSTPKEVANYGHELSAVVFQPRQYIHHAAFEPLGRWGQPLSTSVLGLTRAHRRFLQTRLTIIQAIAAFIRKLSVKGSPGAVNALKNQFQSTLAAGGDSGLSREGNPGAAPGGMFIGGTGVEMENLKLDTGSESANVDGRMLVTSIGTGLGVFPHYLGEGESFRLATATAMEPPMMRMFLGFQKLWEVVYTKITLQALSWQSIPEAKRYIRLDFPEITPRNMSALLESFALLFKAAPGLLEIPDVQKIVLALIGVDDAQALVESFKSENLDLRPAAEKNSGMSGTGNPAGDPNSDPEPEPAGKDNGDGA